MDANKYRTAYDKAQAVQHEVWTELCQHLEHAGICYTIPNMTGGTSPAPLPNFTRRHQTMKVLKALLAVLTTLAVALTAILLFWQDKSAPRYIKIYENEQ